MSEDVKNINNEEEMKNSYIKVINGFFEIFINEINPEFIEKHFNKDGVKYSEFILKISVAIASSVIDLISKSTNAEPELLMLMFNDILLKSLNMKEAMKNNNELTH